MFCDHGQRYGMLCSVIMYSSMLSCVIMFSHTLCCVSVLYMEKHSRYITILHEPLKHEVRVKLLNKLLVVYSDSQADGRAA